MAQIATQVRSLRMLRVHHIPELRILNADVDDEANILDCSPTQDHTLAGRAVDVRQMSSCDSLVELQG